MAKFYRIHPPAGDLVMELDSEVFHEWLSSSQVLFITVLVVSMFTLPLLFASLYALRSHKKSQYYVCLCSIIMANIVLLGTICFSVLLDRFPQIGKFFHGSMMCKLKSFLVNVSSCFVHWTWVLMYLTRCVMVFFPLQGRRNGLILQGWIPVIGVLVFSIFTQLWTPVLMTELTVKSNGVVGSFCDASIIGTNLVQIIAVTESVLTFFVPFVLTVLTDISVLVLHRPCQPAFTLIPKEDVGEGTGKGQYLKIVSKKNIEDWQQRRHVAIRRCLLMATINLLLNLPNYSLQLIDEFLNLRSGENVSLFIWADAIAYILYLCQFTLVPVYLYFLRADLKRSSSRVISKKMDLSACREQSNAANDI